MPELLHEYWEAPTGNGEFGVVREQNDEIRPQLMPGARLVFSIRAASWFGAMQLYQERLGYGNYEPPDGVPNHFYTNQEAAEQEEYLSRRHI